MKAHDLAEALRGVVTGEVHDAEEDAAAFPRLACFNAGAVCVGRFSGETPGERHPDADELLHVLESCPSPTTRVAEEEPWQRVPA